MTKRKNTTAPTNAAPMLADQFAAMDRDERDTLAVAANRKIAEAIANMATPEVRELEPTLADRLADMARKSAAEAERIAEACVAACLEGDARKGKRLKRECEQWVAQVRDDAMRAQGAECAAVGKVDAPMPAAAELALTRAGHSLERAQIAYRALKMPASAN